MRNVYNILLGKPQWTRGSGTHGKTVLELVEVGFEDSKLQGQGVQLHSLG